MLENIVFDNSTDIEVDLTIARQILEQLAPLQELELIITNNQNIQEINYTSRGVDKPTDVLSFPYENMPNTPLGSIIISADFVKEKAQFYNHSINDEFNLLFIHGILHILGYDHEVDNGEHRSKEEELIKQYKLPDSLIVRNS